MKIILLENCRNCENLENLLQFLNLVCEVKRVKSIKAFKSPEMQEKSLYHNFPILEHSNYFLNDYYAILKYIAHSSSTPNLLGENKEQEFLGDQFMLLAQKIDLKMGELEAVIDEKEKDQRKTKLIGEVNALFTFLENKLKFEAFLNGTRAGHADLLLFFSFKRFLKLDPYNKFSNLKRHSTFFDHAGLKSFDN